MRSTKKIRAVPYHIGRWCIRIIKGCMLIIILFCLLLLSVDNNIFGWFGATPTLAEIKWARDISNEASEVYSEDGVLLGRYFREDRSRVCHEELPDMLIQMLIDTEDERFYQHGGIDIIGLLSAGRDLVQGHPRGASTLTQQLAKNLYVRSKKGSQTGQWGHTLFIKKTKEWIIATKMEHVMNKEEILTMYFNTMDFGCQAYGIKTACRRYFGCSPQYLKPEEAATLVGLLKGTSLYNPRTNPQKCKERRNAVLTRAFQRGHLTWRGKKVTSAQLDSLTQLPIRLVKFEAIKREKDAAPYFRQALIRHIQRLGEQGYIEGYDKENPVNLETDGLHIFTTLDTRMQHYAEEAVHEQMKKVQELFDEHWKNRSPWRDEHLKEIPGFLEHLAMKTGYYKYYQKLYKGQRDSIFHHLWTDKHPVKVFSYDGSVTKHMSVMDSIQYMVRFLHCSMVAIEPDTRHVKAWVGDVDFDSWQHDKVLAQRQPGSTFKLFVYAEALKQGLTPEDRRMDSYQQYLDTTLDGRPCIWEPHNADGRFTNRNVTLHEAFAVSINSIAVQLGYECGIQRIAQTAHDMGIESKLKKKPSLALGASETNLLELTNAYCTPVDEGLYNAPILITHIEDRNGRIIYEARNKDKQAIPEKTASQLMDLLKACMRGTSYNLQSQLGAETYNRTEWGGKTGTSNNHSDAWFVAVTPRLVCGCWVGGEYRCIHFRSGEMGQSNMTALPVCANFMGRVLRDSIMERYRARF